ncbi:16S rRNA (guanine(1207)-N(2))-methyltransferase RsmC [Arsenophonus apicola]|jgi:16S rRNA (guanine1207-N2)-methyltransferase|uniref:16S rRNA (guanine(1207)-N(2))-methyltransferase RsmC n=1 Tax=Arsenophonus apicola TaxID=2879119 RepID=UPI0038797EC4
MSSLTPASEVILRHDEYFIGRRVLIAGNLQDNISSEINAEILHILTNQYHYWLSFNKALGENAHYDLTLEKAVATQFNTLIYFWPKNKQEANFQLQNICSVLPIGSDIFIVGENRSGVNSVDKILKEIGCVRKVDAARRCSLYYCQLEKQPSFHLPDWWNIYKVADITIKTLPGVFSQQALDTGSQLLLSTFQTPIKGKLLDMASGCGVLGTVIGKKNPNIKLTLCDTHAAAITSSIETLKINGLTGHVIASDIYSMIEDSYDWIICNPPFHDGLKTDYSAAETIIKQAPSYLKSGGKFRMVANAFLPYPNWLDKAFGRHEILAQTGKFKIYQASKFR